MLFAVFGVGRQRTMSNIVPLVDLKIQSRWILQIRYSNAGFITTSGLSVSSAFPAVSRHWTMRDVWPIKMHF